MPEEAAIAEAKSIEGKPVRRKAVGREPVLDREAVVDHDSIVEGGAAANSWTHRPGKAAARRRAHGSATEASAPKAPAAHVTAAAHSTAAHVTSTTATMRREGNAGHLSRAQRQCCDQRDYRLVARHHVLLLSAQISCAHRRNASRQCAFLHDDGNGNYK
jgi:hypothetical protein